MENTAIGVLALLKNTHGSANTAIGTGALASNTMGEYNTAIGYYAGYGIIEGIWNTTIGFAADVGVDNIRCATSVEYHAVVNIENSMKLGGYAVSTQLVDPSNAGLTLIKGSSAYFNASDARFKCNIKDNVPGLNFIYALNPVTYNFDFERYEQHLLQNMPDRTQKERMKGVSNAETINKINTNFLAQDVEAVCKKLGYPFDGLHIPSPNNKTVHYILAYSQFIMPLVKGMQEQQAQIETLQKQNADLLKRLEKLENK